MKIFKKYFLSSLLSVNLFSFSGYNACNVIDIYEGHPKMYAMEELPDGVIIDPIKKTFNMSNCSKIYIKVMKFENDKKTYSMIIESDSENICYYTLITDKNIPDTLLNKKEIIVCSNTPSFELLKDLFLLNQEYNRLDDEEHYNIFGEYFYQGQEEYLDLLSSKKQYLYNSMLLCINTVLNNLSKIY